MALVRGAQCLCPCPICLISADKQSDLSWICPLCTADDTQAILNHARDMKTAADREDHLKAHGIRGVDVGTSAFVLLNLIVWYRTFFGTLPTLTFMRPSAGIVCTRIMPAYLENTFGPNCSHISMRWDMMQSMPSMTSSYHLYNWQLLM